MRKVDALRLKYGDIIEYANASRSEHILWVREGQVRELTPRGGIRVRDDAGHLEWIPYHHAIRRVHGAAEN